MRREGGWNDHARPPRPSWARATAFRTRSSCPRVSPRRASWSSMAPGRRRRVTSTSRADAGTRAWPRWPTTPAATAARRASSARAPSTTRWRWSSSSGRTRRGWPCADRAWAASPPSTPRPRDPALCAVVAICPAPEDLLVRALRADGPERFRCDVAATEAWLRSLDIFDAVGGAGARHRPAPPARPRRRAGALHRERAAVRGRPRAQAPAPAAGRPPPLAAARHGAPGGVAPVRAQGGARRPVVRTILV